MKVDLTIINPVISFIGKILLFNNVFTTLLIAYFPKDEKEEISFNGVSFLIPARNEQKRISLAIQSALDADKAGHDFEIIVINDGSIDKTKEVVEKNFSAHIEAGTVKLINQVHSGKSRGLNNATKIARFDLIAALDADTYIQNDTLAKAIECIKHKNVGAVGSIINVINNNHFYSSSLYILCLGASFNNYILSKLNASIYITGPFSLLRKKVLVEVGGYNENILVEDADLAFRLYNANYRVKLNWNIICHQYYLTDIKTVIRRRVRWTKGFLRFLRDNIKLKIHPAYLISLPIVFLSTFNASLIGIKRIVDFLFVTDFHFSTLTFDQVLFSINYFSIYGLVRWTILAFKNDNLNEILFSSLTWFVTLKSLFLNIFYVRKFYFWHWFVFYFSLLYFSVAALSYPLLLWTLFQKNQPNIWKKNE